MCATSRVRANPCCLPVEDLLDQSEHPILIEVTSAQIGVSPVA
jgi:hypothetical protein